MGFFFKFYRSRLFYTYRGWVLNLSRLSLEQFREKITKTYQKQPGCSKWLTTQMVLVGNAWTGPRLPKHQRFMGSAYLWGCSSTPIGPSHLAIGWIKLPQSYVWNFQTEVWKSCCLDNHNVNFASESLNPDWLLMIFVFGDNHIPKLHKPLDT